MEIFKVALERRCNLNLSELSEVVADESLIEILKSEKSSRTCKSICDDLYERLHTYGGHADVKLRRAVLEIRRDIFNNRLPNNKIISYLLDFLDLDTARLLTFWLKNAQQKIEFKEQAEKLYSFKIQESREVIATLFSENSHLACGIQTANRRVYMQAKDYTQAIFSGKKLNKKLRNTEDRLISFIYKAASKPSPFGSFVSIIPRVPSSAIAFTHAKREIRITRDIIHWMESILIMSVSSVAESLPARINNTFRIKNNKVEFFTRGRDGLPGMLGGERFIEFEYTQVIDLIIKSMSSSIASILSLEAILESAGMKQHAARAYLDKLVQSGFLEIDFSIPGQTCDYTYQASLVLKNLPNRRGINFAGYFSSLAAIEQKYQPLADAKDREPFTKEVIDCLVDFTKAIDISSEAVKGLQDLYFEDMAELTEKSEGAEILNQKEKHNLHKLTPLLMLFDSQLTSRISLHSIFKEMYGKSSEPVGLLDFYKAWRMFPKEELFSRLTPERDPQIAHIFKLRKQYLDLILTYCDQQNTGEYVDLSGISFEPIIPVIEPYLDSRSISFFVQDIKNAKASKVLNNAGTGFGCAMSRFAGLLEEQAHNLSDRISQQIDSVCGTDELYDIGCVFAANTNLRPAIIKKEITYPGCLPRQDSQGSLSLQNIQIKLQENALILQRRDTGKKIEFIPQNFIHPSSGPVLYRFLHLFSSHWLYRSQDLISPLITARQTELPRICYGPIVLARQVTQFSVASILENIGSRTSDFEAFSALNLWRLEHKLPQLVFFRASVQLASIAENDKESVEQISALRRGRLRKPHMLDFHNPFLVKIFIKQISSLKSSDLVQLHESLPDVNLGDEYSVSEMLVQLDHVKN